jgi:ubiquinone/menaquinone biosynthesis C-methylase UbiE
MGIDLRLTFNEDVLSYERFRPTYTAELFEDVIHYSNLTSHKEALEIGIGTGQATLPFLSTGCHLTAIELGDKLAQFTREKFAQFQGFKVINQDFESVELKENTYDLIYSASAFHWIPVEIGLPKVYRLLKSGGVFAWFSNQPAPAQEHIKIHEEFQKVYRKHSKYFGDASPVTSLEMRQKEAEDKRRKRFDLLQQYGFVDVMDQLYFGSRLYDANEYTTLISTYSDHKAMPEEVRIPFLKEIEDVINANGGKFSLSDTMILCMGRKE